MAAYPAKAAEPPSDVQKILEDSGVSAEDAGQWSFSGIVDAVGDAAAKALDKPLTFGIRALVYLSLSCVVSLTVGSGSWKRCVDAVAVLGFGALSLSAMMELVAEVNLTAQQSQAYLISFAPVYSSIAVLGGQTAGGAAYSGLFLAMSSFLATAMEKLLLPLMGIYFCFAASAAVWGNSGIEEAAQLFSRCLTWLLKTAGGIFGVVLGMQNVLAGTVDTAALRVGKSILSGAIPVVGDAAAAALSSATAAVHLLKESLALAAVTVLGASFLPVFLRCGIYYLAFSGAGILAAGSGQKQCGQLCRLFADGARLCGSILTLYFFMVFLSTLLLLITGNGG